MTVNLHTEVTADWPVEDIPFEVMSIDLAVLPGPHPLHVAHRQEVEENWAQEIAANPHLFNGQMVLQHRVSIRDGVIVGEAYEIPYAMLMWWRKQPEPAGAFHLFGFAALVSSDGALIAVRMSDHTANPGQVYCAAGSLDLHDIVEGKLDLVGNMRREVMEETGLDLSDATADPQFFATHNRHRITVFRFYRFEMTADEMVSRIEANMVHDAEREIAGAVAIRSGNHDAHPYNPPMHPILDMFFGVAGN